ncbi:alpha/beta fold hydrolase [Bordetella sp. 2513F-2]
MRTAPDLPARSVRLDGFDTTYVEHGSGTPLVLIHGSLSDYRYWTPQFGPLGRAFRVLAPSLRRHWPERWDGKGGGFSIAEHARQVLELVERVAGEPAHLVGHSRGGRVALEAARLRPGLVRTLTLADPGLSLPGEADVRGDFRRHALERLSAGETEEGLRIFIDAVTGPDTWRRMVPWFKEMVRDNAGTLAGQNAEPPAPLDDDAIRSLSLPVLLIGGALSPQPYPTVLERLQRLLPHAERVTIAGSSHGMNLGNPRAFNEAIAAFLGS